MKLSQLPALLLLPLAMSTACLAQTQPKPLTLTDIMHFESLLQPVIADEGQVLAVEVAPDRGDSHVLVRRLKPEPGLAGQFDVLGGANPRVSHDGRFVAMEKPVSLLSRETADAKTKKQLKAGMILLDTHSGEQQEFERVQQFVFSPDGTHLAILFAATDDKADKADKQETGEADKAKPVDEADRGSAFSLLSLKSGKRRDFESVTAFQFDKGNHGLALAINDGAQGVHELKYLRLTDDAGQTLLQSKTQQIGALALSEDGRFVAMLSGDADTAPDAREYGLILIEADTGKRREIPSATDWKINRHASLRFSDDGERLYFGRVPAIVPQPKQPVIAKEAELFDEEIIAAKRALRIWHGDDRLIKPNEVKEYDNKRKQTYLAVLHIQANRLLQLTDESLPEVSFPEHGRFLLASSSLPYQKMATWAGGHKDHYLVDIHTGERIAIATQLPEEQVPTVSANGKFAAFYRQGEAYLFDVAKARQFSLTKGLKVGFADEDHDYPNNAPGYGFGPWIEGDSGLLLYDKYDIWQFDTRTLKGTMLTAGEGRKHKLQLRVTGLPQDGDKSAVLEKGQPLLLQGYSEQTKADAFYSANTGQKGIRPLLEGEHKLTVLARSKDADTLVYSRQRYDLYPDLYASDLLSPQDAVRQTEFDNQRQSFAWGQAELVRWTDGDGRPLDGVLIKPTDYQPGKRYPVMLYFYRFMSDRLHAFPDMKINHRPNFAWYADNGYAIFLPDIRFEVGYPGPSSVKALTSGVQKIIEMGVADPDAVGIHGHSWGGYQTAFAVTQTHIFKAAVAGAPVSNMTSAYSGIRHGTGLARQFQYEMGQSRIGESLFDAPQKYIENSPVFYAERIKTPMMIMFGDKDDAVPWEQGVELYLAMRRAGKEVVFLQYQDEPHHPQKYANKLDYTVRMKQYFDHYLKGLPAPEWLKNGEAYVEYQQQD